MREQDLLTEETLAALPDKLQRWYNYSAGASGLCQNDVLPTVEPDLNGGYSLRFYVQSGLTLERLVAVAAHFGRGHFGSDPWVYHDQDYPRRVVVKVDGVPAEALSAL